MGKTKDLTGKVLYGLLFIGVIPFLLFLWAKNTGETVNLPLPENPIYGYILLIGGTFLVFSGMWNLWNDGQGLPMNAFPPGKFVKNGIYSVTKHPIYSGAVLISFGLSVVYKSSSGLWLVSPLFIIMIVAYVAGFENERTLLVFGEQNYKPFLSLPDSEQTHPSLKERISSYFLVFVPWLIVYEAFILAGTPSDAIVTNLSFEEHFPVWEFSEIFYSSAYLLVLFIPLVIKTKKELRLFITDLWFATIFVGIVYFVFPFIVSRRPFIPQTLLGDLLLYEHSIDGVTAAFPSFHVIWAFIFARYFTDFIRSLKWLWYLLAVLISISCITTSSHSIPDVLAGFLTFIIILYRKKIWDHIRLWSERLSNSWHEWRFGKLRIINHGLYGGAAGFTGTLMAGLFLGSQNVLAVLIVMIFVIIGAGLWAQFIEGSPKLLRPFGYYGGLIGGIIACAIVSPLFSINIFTLLASFAMTGPWIQSIGRLRCLVQGCCHGKPASADTGIRFTHPYSRVNKISGLRGIPLHPTQLYSIGTNIVSGVILFRLFSLEMSSAFIIGMYLIMNGLGRFVEESFRGEAQTPYWAGMRIYQWIAILNIAAGAVFTTIHNSGSITFQPNTWSLIVAGGIGLLVTFASGIDFPESNRRFARLTSA